MYLATEDTRTNMVFHILENGYHQPVVQGKCDRDHIEEQITIGILAQHLPPMSQDDVDWVCDLVDIFIEDINNCKDEE